MFYVFSGKVIQVTSSKMIQSPSTSKQKLGDKRSTSSTFAPDPKKKKSGREYNSTSCHLPASHGLNYTLN